MARMRFSLRRLLWLVTCCAIAFWLVTLPALWTMPVKNWNSNYNLDGSSYFSSVDAPTHWPLEVLLRILACALLFVLPAIVSRIRSIAPAVEQDSASN